MFECLVLNREGVVSAQRGGRRAPRQMACFVSFSFMLEVGCPAKSLVGTDGQSNKQHASLINPGWMKSTWDSKGIVLFALMEGLIHSPRLAAERYNVLETFMSVLEGYYVLLINVMYARASHGKGWQKVFISSVTLRKLHLTVVCTYASIVEYSWNVI